MAFPISQIKFIDVAKFSAKFGVRSPVFTERRVSIFLFDYSIEFVDSEKYMNIIKCELKFNEEISFFIENVAKSIEGEVAKNRFIKNEKNGIKIEEILWNDDYLDRVFLFFEQQTSTLLNPRRWFQAAVEATNKSLVQNFPELSKDYLKINADYFENHFR